MRITSFLSDKHARSDSGRIALALVVVLGIIVVGSMTGWFGLQRGIPAAAPSFAAIPAAPAGLPVSDQTGKPITSYTARIVDGRSGAFRTNINGVLIYREQDDPSDPTVTAFRAFAPNTGTDIQISAGERMKMVFQQQNTDYPASRFGASNRRATAGTVSVPSGVTAAALSVVDTGWPLVYAVSVIDDPFEENSPSGDQSYASNTNATIMGLSEMTNGYNVNCLYAGLDSTPADGDTIFWNDSSVNCGGSFRIRLDYDTGATANAITWEPQIAVEDPNFNRTGNEVTSATLTVVGGSGVAARATDITAALNQNRPILLYPADNPRVDSGKTTTFELSVTYSTANWVNGEAIRLVFDDLGGAEAGRNGWNILSNTTGSAVQTMTIQRQE